MNNVNSPALFRSLIIYAVCVTLAIVAGYALATAANYNFRDLGVSWPIAVIVAVLVFPLLMKWHYPLLIFSWTAPITLFFLPGSPNLFMPMVLVSLTISVVDRILNKERHFLPCGQVKWALLALLAVVIFTAKMTGGIGLRSMGSDVYGGKKYVTMILGILCFFAITARAIPKEKANLYLTLYFMGSLLNIVQDIYPLVPDPLRFIYRVLPVSDRGMDEFGNIQLEWGVTRMFGISTAASTVFSWMLAKNGVRDNLLTPRIWRPVILALSFTLILTGGFRSAILGALLTFGLIFYLERLHRTGLMMAMVFLVIFSGTLLVPLASRLPYTFQRSLAWLPLDIRADARADAEGSTNWRLDIWKAVLPQVPNYLLLGKGFAIKAEDFSNYMGRNATFHRVIDPSQDPLALSNDFHSGPLSLVIGLGIWGVIAWLWFWAAGFWVIWRNYRYGDPQLHHINLFLFANFLCAVLVFLFVFGGIVGDVFGFGVIIGMSIAFNGGVRGPKSLPKNTVTIQPPARELLSAPSQPVFQR